MPQNNYPCLICNIDVEDEDSICCDSCNLWVHLECTELTKAQFSYLSENTSAPYFCTKCSPSQSSSLPTFESTVHVTTSPSPTLINPLNVNRTIPDHDSSILSAISEYPSSCHSSDFDYETDLDDLEIRGLDLNSIPGCSQTNKPPKSFTDKYLGQPMKIRTRKYKYPCSVCHSPCIDRVQNSICCFLCDKWVHQKCTNLTLEQFHKYTKEDNDDPFYCNNCLTGNYGDEISATPDLTSHSVLTSIIDSDDIPTLCPNSVFGNSDDIMLSGYYTIDDLNGFIDIQKTKDNVLLIHVNTDTLIGNFDKLVNTLGQFKAYASILFLSETRLHDSKMDFQSSLINIPNYSYVHQNSPTNAGGTAIYVSNSLRFINRPDIKFECANCEACFIEVICENEKR